MAFLRTNRERAELAILKDLDYHVESLLVHTCPRRDHSLWLLRTAERDQLWLLLEWTHRGSPGAGEAQDA